MHTFIKIQVSIIWLCMALSTGTYWAQLVQELGWGWCCLGGVQVGWG